MKQRVRAVLLTDHVTMLVINRIRPGIPPYQVLVGGGVEDEDTSHKAALLREIREEIAGEATDLDPFYELTNDRGETEYFYTARISTWNFDDRTGPEFSRDDRGEYLLEEVPLTSDAVGALNLMPPEIKTTILDALEKGTLLTAA
ncbi:NUDIX domain-containing protein [Streptomyces sp. TLI_171]|uniref:NUDIX domain-containing protein n=1 Tax=Streptomyces sp. TLI_171 TaxID=1938859 RepID=UPI000C181853|nr:NUDIX domain-containing protein [Streptomyces sp. TLI_171]RKE21955.1 8-oxo-dGTP pyrophosphatase MutT (NUDIX family) [Streptomyces sp. TLI_171]